MTRSTNAGFQIVVTPSVVFTAPRASMPPAAASIRILPVETFPSENRPSMLEETMSYAQRGPEKS
jgi:hypothetical protein